MIRLENLSVAFGDLQVLEDVDLTIERGEFVGLVGPNGAGKTTLLRTINGILQPDAGTVWLDGTRQETLHSKAISRIVATVPQDTHVGFTFTAGQLVEMGRTPHRSRLDWSDDSSPVDAAMERTDTLALRERTADELSGGERQRVLLARALAQEPDALVLDEPTASLDINHRIRVLELVQSLVAEGKTAIAAIHDLELAARFCDRLVLLADGSIQASGPPETILVDPTVAEAYGTETAVYENPVTGTPAVVGLPDRPDRDGHVHVTGGGQAGARAVRILWQHGYDVSLDSVPAGDLARVVAESLDIPIYSHHGGESTGTRGNPLQSEDLPGNSPDAVVLVRDESITDSPAESAGMAGVDVETHGPATEESTSDQTAGVREESATLNAPTECPTISIPPEFGTSDAVDARGDGGSEAAIGTEDDLLAAIQRVLE